MHLVEAITGSKASLTKELDFGKAFSEGYVPYSGPQPSIDTLQDLLTAGSKPGVANYLKEEKESLLQNPQDKLASIAEGEPTVDNLIQALGVTSEEAELIQIMIIGQRNNPLWMDARQWWITASNFGKEILEYYIHLL